MTVEELRPGDDEPRVLTRLFAGAHFGEYSLVHVQPRVASVIARGGGTPGAASSGGGGTSAASATSVTVVRWLDRATFGALVDEDPAYRTVIEALVDETEATRRKRARVLAQSAGSDSGARQVSFVQSNRSTAKITRQALRGVNERRQEFVNNFVLLRQLGAGTYGRVYLCVDSAAVGKRLYAIK